MTDPAATLRAAAERLRTLAEAATQEGGDWPTAGEWRDWELGSADAAYIAAMSPPVALAVADLLESVAAVGWIPHAALAVARLVLGEESDG